MKSFSMVCSGPSSRPIQAPCTNREQETPSLPHGFAIELKQVTINREGWGREGAGQIKRVNRQSPSPTQPLSADIRASQEGMKDV